MLPLSSGFADSIANASGFNYGLFVVITFIIAAGCGWGAYAMFIRKRVLQDTPTALIRSASQGYIELQGHAELMEGAPIVAPLSMRPCVWYRYKVEEKQRRYSGSGSRYEWRTVDRDVSDSLFFLVDSTGRCAVDPEGAKVTPSSRDTWYGNERTPGRIQNTSGWMRFTGLAQMGRHYRYTEERIEAGDPLYALGDFTTHGGAGAHYDRNAEIRELLSEWKQNNVAMLERFDANGDGEIDMNEWEAAREAAGQEADKKRADVAVAPPMDVLSRARGSRNPFVLAAKTEEEMLSQFHWSAVACLSVAVTASVVLIWGISLR